LTGT
jgi:hypothetical protein